jgi:hypothetical protein
LGVCGVGQSAGCGEKGQPCERFCVLHSVL